MWWMARFFDEDGIEQAPVGILYLQARYSS